MINIKEEKIGLIDQINDVETISKIKNYVQELSGNQNYIQLSLEEKEALAKGIQDFEEGHVFTDEEVRKPYAKYFK